MIPPILALVFLLASLGCFYYLFRGFTVDDNSMLANILVSGINTILCAIFVMWFLNGSIVDITVVENITYCMDYDGLNQFQIAELQGSFGTNSYVLDANGAGMYTSKAIGVGNPSWPSMENLTLAYSTHDIIYTQYQEKGLAYFFIFLSLLNAALFLWFVFGSGWPTIMSFIRGSPPATGENLG